MTRPDDARHIRGRIRREIRMWAAEVMGVRDPAMFCYPFTDSSPAWRAFANREHARLVAALRTGRAIGPLTGRRS